MVSDRGVILGRVWVIIVITEAYLVRVTPSAGLPKYTATCPFCVLWPTLPRNFPERSLSVNIMDCTTNEVWCISTL